MVKKTVKFVTPGQILSFCKAYQKMKSDIDVKDVSDKRVVIDGKSLMGMMTIQMGMPMHLVVNGEDEGLTDRYFGNFELH